MPKRLTYLIGLIVVSLLLLASKYIEIIDKVLPCPLCLLQRYTFALLAFWFFLGFMFARKRIACLIILFFSSLTAAAGMGLAGRQVWLQHTPNLGNNECGAGLEYMLKVFPWQVVLKKTLQGGTECATRGAEFLLLNMAEWSLVWFGLFFVASITLLIKVIRSL